MNSEEKFKQSLQDLLDTKEFSFDEANWLQAEKVINDSKRKGLWPFIFGVLLFLISGVVTFAYFNSPQPASTHNLAHNSESQAEKASQRNQEILETSNLKGENTKSNYSSKQYSAENASKSSPPEEDKAVAESHDGVAEISLTKQIKQHTLPTSAVDKKVEIVKQQANSIVPNVPVGLTNAKIKEDKKENSPEAITKQRNSESAKTEVLNPLPVKEKAESKQDATILTASANPGLVDGSEKSMSYFQLTQIKTLLINPQDDKEIIPSKDTIAKAAVNFANDLKRSTFFSIEAGASYVFGWKNSDIKEGNGFNPVFGINYHTSFTQKTFLSIGIQYTSLGNMSFNSHTFKVTRYGLGEESKVTIITPNKIQYLVVPIKLDYHLNASNIIGLGCNIAYLLNVESKIETYNEGFSVAKANYTISKTKGYTEGFKTFDTQLSFFYKRQLYKNLFLNTEFVYGLTDIKDNSFFKSSVFERNQGIKATLVYKLFKK